MGRIELLPHPFPDRRHVGEEAEVAEGGALRGKARFAAPAQFPAILGHWLGVLPAPATILVAAGDEFAMRIPHL